MSGRRRTVSYTHLDVYKRQVLQTIPTAIIGAVSFVLYGMISSIGLRSLVESKPDFSQNRNLLIVAVILVTGLGMPAIQITDTVSISGLFVATLVGVLLNVIPVSYTHLRGAFFLCNLCK